MYKFFRETLTIILRALHQEQHMVPTKKAKKPAFHVEVNQSKTCPLMLKVNTKNTKSFFCQLILCFLDSLQFVVSAPWHTGFFVVVFLRGFHTQRSSIGSGAILAHGPSLHK